MRDPRTAGRVLPDPRYVRYCPTGDRPILVPPPYPGKYTVPLYTSCTPDYFRSAWPGKHEGPAKVHTVEGPHEPGEMFAQKWTGEFTTHETERGPISLPKPSTYYRAFVPSTAALKSLPYTGTRMTPISDRYYKGPISEPCVRSKASLPSTSHY